MLDRRELFEQTIAASLADCDFDISFEQLNRISTIINPDRARNVFSVFRRSIRPGMLWGPFVNDLTMELYKFYKSFLAGERPKLAISVGPQHGKPWAVEDFIAWAAGRNSDLKTIYASYTTVRGQITGMEQHL